MSDTSTTKICKGCGEEKERSEFHKHPKHKDGLFGKCKVCANRDTAAYYRAHKAETKKQKAEYRAKNIDLIRQHNRTRNGFPERKAARDIAVKRYRRENPAAHRAHWKVAEAILVGKLIRPEACSLCGSTNRIIGHHADYDKPLEVQWICDICHSQIHKEITSPTKEES